MSSAAGVAPSRLLPADVVRVGTVAFRTRRTRAVLSALARQPR